MAASINREMVFLLLQFLDDENMKKTARTLEKESGFFFNMRYLEEIITNGEWDEVESYLSSFTRVYENRYSTKIFFEILKQKYLEALDKHDKDAAIEILTRDLKVFQALNENLYKDLTMLLTLNNFREVDQLCLYRDAKSARSWLFIELRRLIQANPIFRDKLQFPSMQNARLRELINQGLNWQHHLCDNPSPNPYIRSLFVDHVCDQGNNAQASSSTATDLMGQMPRGGGFIPTGAPGVKSMASSSSPNLALSLGPMSLNPTNAEVVCVCIYIYIHIYSTQILQVDEAGANNAQLMHMQIDEAGPSNAQPLHMQVDEAGPSNAQPSCSYEDLPRTVVANLNQGSAVKSMDFHPFQQTLLLVGTITGDVSVWEVGCGRMLASRKFKVWDIGACSLELQASLANDYNASVTCVRWTPDGNGFGVAYSKRKVQLLSYHGGDDLRNHLEVEAHVGSVNGLAFYRRHKQLLFITCGEDTIVKVWDAATGTRQYTFEGHDSPVYSVCPHTKGNIDFIFSTDVDGKIKVWLYDDGGARVDYEAPGRCRSTMAYTADGTRLFSCGTNRDGESHVVEWNDTEGTLKRTYLGLGRQASLEKVHFDTAKNRFLAAGDEFVIKYWDIDNVNLLCTVDADGGLPASPCIRFNKLGTLLAVSTNASSVKVLANAATSQLLRFNRDHTSTSSSKAASTVQLGASGSRAGTSNTVTQKNTPTIILLDDDVNPVTFNEKGKSKILRPIEISGGSQLRSLKLPDSLLPVRIMQLDYTNSGDSILALTGNAIHKLWKWRSNGNMDGRVTTAVVPQLWQPSGEMLMTNDISDMNLEEVRVPCFTISKNDVYLTSSSGGKISLFNMMTFKRVSTFMTSPPPTTSLAFFPPDNNIIAIGREDAAILIYNIRMDELIATLTGHCKRVSSLAFSTALDILVSLGEDAKLCLWSTRVWEKKESKSLQLAPECTTNPRSRSRLQFHPDQTHILVFHKMLIAIYEAIKLECINQWFPERWSPAITDATFSSDGRTVYATFDDGSVGIFFAPALQIRCRINPTSYILLPNPSSRIYPLVVAANPVEPNQLAVGLSDGSVCVLEPLGTDEN
ncbi:topless-related protein 4-like [Dorcoceras hygrometricum]|uniref:Topless-related protein 4-like n=1 Tax=Dorcoceras hygrometricum TaxID=472368 RepID=A0A2Z7DBM5_9LAMI|nr:topless-related protein 4-like [Dorcoceras hygrometricum]